MSSFRLRDLGITIGNMPTGPLNAITDVPGVLVGHLTLIEDQPHVVRTGITVTLSGAVRHTGPDTRITFAPRWAAAAARA